MIIDAMMITCELYAMVQNCMHLHMGANQSITFNSYSLLLQHIKMVAFNDALTKQGFSANAVMSINQNQVIMITSLIGMEREMSSN